MTKQINSNARKGRAKKAKPSHCSRIVRVNANKLKAKARACK